MKEAVACLSSPDQQKQHCGASFIQHSTFLEDKAKQEVGPATPLEHHWRRTAQPQKDKRC